MSVIVVKGTRPDRSVTEIENVIGGSKRANGKTNDVYNTPNKCLHNPFSFSPRLKNPASFCEKRGTPVVSWLASCDVQNFMPGSSFP
jgi:hypothetical protein